MIFTDDMSTPMATLKQFIIECLINESIIRRDDNGHLIIRKLVKFTKQGSRFNVDDNVSTDLTSKGIMVVDDVEQWIPNFDDEDVLS